MNDPTSPSLLATRTDPKSPPLLALPTAALEPRRDLGPNARRAYSSA